MRQEALDYMERWNLAHPPDEHVEMREDNHAFIYSIWDGPESSERVGQAPVAAPSATTVVIPPLILSDAQLKTLADMIAKKRV